MQKVALVTGSSSGIGFETSLALARDGYHTFASMRDTSKGAQLQEIARKEMLPVDIIELDVDNKESIVSAIKKMIEDAGRIDGFIMAMDQDTDYDSSNFLWFKDKFPEFHYVDRVVVAPGQRRKGFGSFLYGKLLREQNGAPIVAEVSVEPANKPSVIFHEGMGFEQVGENETNGHLNRMYALN